ncbi:MAG: DUF1207 domain-containing protein [Longimicrobiales bacterium]
MRASQPAICATFLVSMLLGSAVPTEGQLYDEALFSHPRRVRTFIGAYQERQAPLPTTVARVGLGDGLILAEGVTEGGTEYGVGLSSGVFAEFDMEVSSFDFFVADFIVGIPVRLGRNNLSGRFRLYHQSSHFGDDIFEREDIELDYTRGYDFEAVDLYLGYQIGPVYPYVGFDYRIRGTPSFQDKTVYHAGFSGRHGREDRTGISVLAGGHVEFTNEGDGSPGFTTRAGVEFPPVSMLGPTRFIRLLLEGRWGGAGAGRFFQERRSGVGFMIEIGR